MASRVVRVRLPTHAADWRRTARTAWLVLRGPGYAAFAAVAAFATLTLFVASQNLPLIRALVVGGTLSLADRATLVAQLYPVVGTDYPPASAAVLVATAAAVGVNLSMVAYHVREHGVSARDGGGSLAGVVLGALGAGCAACGSAVLVGVLSLMGVTGAVTLLPLDGLEFALLALAVLLLSTYWLAEGMRGGEIRGCPVDLDDDATDGRRDGG